MPSIQEKLVSVLVTGSTVIYTAPVPQGARMRSLLVVNNSDKTRVIRVRIIPKGATSSDTRTVAPLTKVSPQRRFISATTYPLASETRVEIYCEAGEVTAHLIVEE